MTPGPPPVGQPSQMRREIEQIPAAVAALLDAVEPEVAPAAAALRGHAPAWLTIVARGTSDHAAVYARYLVETALGIPTGLAAASVTTAYGATLRWKGGAVLAISQSGESPDLVEVMRTARGAGAVTIAITNHPTSPLAAAAEHVIECHAGDELAVPATKTYVTQLAAVASLVGATGEDDALLGGLQQLPAILSATVARGGAWLDSQSSSTSVAAAIAAAGRALVVSRGHNLATALEIALKLKEMAGIFAEAYSAADFLHGPVALAGPLVPTLVIRPDGPTAASVDEAAAAAEQRGSPTWRIGMSGDGSDRELALRLGPLEALSPISLVVPGYLIAEDVARRRGLDPDAPTGLRKVTRTR